MFGADVDIDVRSMAGRQPAAYMGAYASRPVYAARIGDVCADRSAAQMEVMLVARDDMSWVQRGKLTLQVSCTTAGRTVRFCASRKKAFEFWVGISRVVCRGWGIPRTHHEE